MLHNNLLKRWAIICNFFIILPQSLENCRVDREINYYSTFYIKVMTCYGTSLCVPAPFSPIPMTRTPHNPFSCIHALLQAILSVAEILSNQRMAWRKLQ